MQQYVDQARIFLNNVLRVSIGSNVITDAYHNVVVNLTAIKTLNRMEGVGADFDWTLGQFSVKKAGTTTNSQQAKFIVDQLNAEMMGLRNI